MPAHEASIDIAADPRTIFDLIHDYDHRLEWDPFLKDARLLHGAMRAGLGIEARCVARDRLGGLAMDTVYVSFEPPRVAAVRMTRGPAILASFAASLRQIEIRPGVTRVTYRFTLAASPWFLRWLLDSMLSAIFARETRRRLAALKRAIEGS